MKTTKTQITRNGILAAAVIGILAVAAPGFTWMGGWYGDWMGPAAQGTIQSAYQPQLNALQQKINAKSSELASARADGQTAAQIQALENEIYQLESQYRTLYSQANAEAVQGTGPRPYMPCGRMGYPHRGGYMMGPMMSGRYAPCGW